MQGRFPARRVALLQSIVSIESNERQYRVLHVAKNRDGEDQLSCLGGHDFSHTRRLCRLGNLAQVQFGDT